MYAVHCTVFWVCTPADFYHLVPAILRSCKKYLHVTDEKLRLKEVRNLPSGTYNANVLKTSIMRKSLATNSFASNHWLSRNHPQRGIGHGSARTHLGAFLGSKILWLAPPHSGSGPASFPPPGPLWSPPTQERPRPPRAFTPSRAKSSAHPACTALSETRRMRSVCAQISFLSLALPARYIRPIRWARRRALMISPLPPPHFLFRGWFKSSAKSRW